mmetsp:Transcript_43277/g.78788  ORF Transcript_43277/g.78788 Transcript_43277/m.78788 type:complete len:695 (-) Transcript_43277:102-2186(-)
MVSNLFSRKQETDLERNLREATSNEKWPASNTQLLELCDASTEFANRSKIMTEVWAALSEKPSRFQRIQKGLALAEVLLKHGSDDLVSEIVGKQMKFRALFMFEYSQGGQDVGATIRERAKAIVNLLNDPSQLKESRAAAKEHRAKFGGVSSGLGGEQPKAEGREAQEGEASSDSPGASPSDDVLAAATAAALSANAPSPGMLRGMADSAGGLFASVRDRMKDNSTELQKKVREAVSNDKWGVSNTLLFEICDATENSEDRSFIITELWAALQDKPSKWNRILKGLNLLEALLKNAKQDLVTELIGGQMKVRALTAFEYTSGGQDCGLRVREKVKSLVTLMNDPAMMKEERQKAKQHREKFQGISSSAPAADSAATKPAAEEAEEDSDAEEQPPPAKPAAAQKQSDTPPAAEKKKEKPPKEEAKEAAAVAAAPPSSPAGWGAFDAPGSGPTLQQPVPTAAAPASQAVNLLDMTDLTAEVPAPAVTQPAAVTPSTPALQTDLFSIDPSPPQAAAPAPQPVASDLGSLLISGVTTPTQPTAPAAPSPATNPSALLGDLTQLYAASSVAPTPGGLGNPVAPCPLSGAPLGGGFNALTVSNNQQGLSMDLFQPPASAPTAAVPHPVANAPSAPLGAELFSGLGSLGAQPAMGNNVGQAAATVQVTSKAGAPAQPKDTFDLGGGIGGMAASLGIGQQKP